MELFHLLNRGVDKRNIFLDDSDRARFVHNLFEFNDSAPAHPLKSEKLDLRSPTFRRRSRDVPRQDRLVDIHSWCLMKNHYHLLLSEKVEGGITKFIRKLNIGYSKYFNERYERSGALFQGRTKRVLIARDAHFLYIPHYIHLNPLDYVRSAHRWREGKIASAQSALAHLNNYRWSSYLDYIGAKNFPSILTTTLFGALYRDYKRELARYVADLETEHVTSTQMRLE